MKRVLIVEDEKDIRNALVKLVEDIRDDITAFQTENSEKAYRIAMEHDIDLFIIDIVLKPRLRGDVSGLLFADGIRKVDRYKFTPLIFITSIEDPRLQAYEQLHCYGYISKPYVVKDTVVMIRKALEYKSYIDQDRNIYFKKDGIFYLKKLSDIIYIKSTSGKMIIKTVDDELEIFYKTCGQMLKELDSDEFLQCNRKVIVNKRYIYSIDSTNRYITLRDGYGVLELGITMKKDFLKKMQYD